MVYKFVCILLILINSWLYADGSSPKPIGLGFIIGSPSGFHAKFRTSAKNDIDAMLGIDWDDWFFVHADYLWNFGISSDANLGLYVGPGGFLATHSGGNDKHKTKLFGPQGVFGFRIILGGQFDIFAELQARMNIIDDTDIFLDGGLGAHFYF